MKYRLKKDLPFAKAGNEVVVLASPITRYKRIQISNSLSAPMCELHEDQVSLWIEEVKPREFYLSIDDNGKIYQITPTREEAYKGWNEDRVKIIKLREVIE